MAELPREKLSATAPFVFTAVDLFGPFLVRDAAKGTLLRTYCVMLALSGTSIGPIQGLHIIGPVNCGTPCTSSATSPTM